MLKHLILKVAPAVVALLLLAMPALAGGVVVTLDGDPPNAEAGKPFTVNFTVRSAHDGQPESGLKPEVTAIHPATHEVVTVIAQPGVAPGQYAASLTLPAEGEWSWQIQPYGEMVSDYPPSEFTPIRVSASGAQAETASSAVQGGQTVLGREAGRRAALAPWLVWAGIIALATAATSAFVLRVRRRAMARP